VIALYGDHNGLWERDKEEVETFLTKETITDEQWFCDYVPVPLLLYNPQIKGESIEVYGGQVDFLPTIAGLMGSGPEEYKYAMGTNLLAGEDKDVLVPGGDYIKQTLRVNQDNITSELRPRELQTLDIADKIIRTNFFARTKSQ
jgi:phosphoglycerol transferase MdoB-like AlkP superfamily enzyme